MPTLPAPPWRVLYAEDDRVAALLFEEALRARARFEVQVAETGAEALALAGQWQPHVLVLDAHLPDTTAIALLPLLRRLPGLADTPVVICSADGPVAGLDAPPAADITAWWTKPVAPARLDDDLAALIRRMAA